MSVRRLDPVQPASFAFTPENASWAKKIIAKFPPGKQASAVIQLLWRAQEQEGWVSKPVIEAVAKTLEMSFIRVYEVATFYTMFHLSPVGRKAHFQVCGTTPCMLRGAEDLIAVCQRKIHHDPQHLNADGTMSWEEVECLGSCVNAPMMQVFSDTYEDLTPESLEKIIDDFAAGREVKPGPQNGRQFSMAITGATSLTDKSLYGKQLTFTRVEAPPPPPPAPAAAAAPAAVAPTPPAPAAAPTLAAPPPASTGQSAPPSPAAVKPAAADIRPVSVAAQAADAQKEAMVSKEAAAPASGNVTTEKAQAETGVVRTSPDKVEKAAIKTPPANAPAVTRVAKVADAPVTAAVKKAAKKAAPPAPAKAAGPELLKKPRGKADDLKLIWGVGPALEKLLNKIGIWHFDQIASWTAADLVHVDARLEGFHGRAKRDEWVKQSKKLAKGWRPEHAVGDKPTTQKTGKK